MRERPADLHDQVLDSLGRDLGAGALPVGSAHSLEALATRYAVSRTVIREAVRVLESMQVVTSRRRVGVTVRPTRDWDAFDPRVVAWRLAGPDRVQTLVQLGELRLGFEPVAASLAATRADGAQCAALTGAVMGMAATARERDLEAYLGHDTVFHRTVLEASGNHMLRALAGIVEAVLTGRTHHQLMPADPNPAAIRLHGDVAEAIGAGDGPAAEEAMRAIVTEAMHALSEIGAD